LSADNVAEQMLVLGSIVGWQSCPTFIVESWPVFVLGSFYQPM